jgi:hypothetical protein
VAFLLSWLVAVVPAVAAPGVAFLLSWLVAVVPAVAALGDVAFLLSRMLLASLLLLLLA